MSTTTRPPSPGRGAGIDRTPLLGVAHRSGWSARLRGSARFLRRTSGRRMIRAPSVNLTFIGIVVGVLILSWHDTQSMPFRLWIFGYVLQCVLHMVCVCVGYRRRHPPEGAVVDVEVGGGRAQIHRGRWKNLMTTSRTKTMIGLGNRSKCCVLLIFIDNSYNISKNVRSPFCYAQACRFAIYHWQISLDF